MGKKRKKKPFLPPDNKQSTPLWKSRLSNQVTIVTTNSPKDSARHWYANLSSSHSSLPSTKKKIQHELKPGFFFSYFSSPMSSSSLLFLPNKYVSRVIFTSSPSLSSRQRNKQKETKRAAEHASLQLPPFSPVSVYQEEKKGRLQWNVCVKALPSVTTRPWPPERLRSTTTLGICTSWIGLFPSFSA